MNICFDSQNNFFFQSVLKMNLENRYTFFLYLLKHVSIEELEFFPRGSFHFILLIIYLKVNIYCIAAIILSLQYKYFGQETQEYSYLYLYTCLYV